MRVTADEAREIVFEGHPEWRSVTGTRGVVGTTRWSIQSTQVFEYLPTGVFYRFKWSVATNTRGEAPFDDDGYYEPVEVALVSRIVNTWEPVRGAV